MIYNGTAYYYLRNAQGDITGLVDSNGTQVVGYTYDAWGNILATTGSMATTLGVYNPLRYRGYVYDTETGLYYLTSRYYNPTWCRFINADGVLSQDSIIGNNLFAYCLNNPVAMTDPSGELPFFLVTAAIGAVAGAVIGGIVAAKNGGSVWAGIGIGAAAGGLIGLGAGAAAATLLTGIATATTAQVVGGAALLQATISAGGLGAGLTYLADNLSRAVNGTGTALYSGGEQALQAAKGSGGTVILDSIGKAAEIVTRDMQWEQAKPIWEEFSAQFCRQAVGAVNAYVCNSAYHGVDSIFWRIEMPTLLNNPKVTEIIIHIFG